MRRGWRALALALLTLSLLLAAVAGAALWLLRTESGGAWLLSRLPGVQAEGFRGALLGREFTLQRLVVTWGPPASAASDAARAAVTVDGLHARGLRWSWQPSAGVWLGLQAAGLRAERVQVQTGPASSEPSTPTTAPASLRLPLQAVIERVEVGTLQVDELAPVRGLALRLETGAEHRIDDLVFAWDRLRASGGMLRVAPDAPFALQATLQLSPDDGAALPWQASLDAEGVLEQIMLVAQLRGEAAAGRVAPALALRAELMPLRAWPIGTLSAHTQALDLQALASALPRTAISGQVEVHTRGADQPLAATLSLENAAAGRLDDGRLPVTRATLALGTDLAARHRVELQVFDLRLGEGGRLQGSGHWQDDRLQLDMRLTAVRPQHLHGAAPAASLSGPLTLRLRGLPSPADADPRLDMAALAGDLNGTIEGRRDGAPQPLTLAIDAGAADGRLLLRQLRAQAGTTTAQLRGSAQRGRGGSWRLRTDAMLERFDPRLWWPGADDVAWMRGTHRLTAASELDLELPAGAAAMRPLALLQRLGGRGVLRVQDSLLAGVPLQGTLELEQKGARATARTRLQGELQLGGNRIVVTGRGDPLGDGSDDHLRAELQAPDIGTLAPLATLLPALADWVPRQGRIDASAGFDGRWPALRTEGRLQAAGVRVGAFGLDTAQLGWRLATVGEAALSLQAEARALQWKGGRADTLRADVQGTLARHRIEIGTTLAGAPPQSLARVLGQAATSGTRGDLRLDGRYTPAAGGGGLWQGVVERLALGGWDRTGKPGRNGAAGASGNGSAGDPVNGAANGGEWLDARDLRAELRFGADGALLGARAEPGAVRLAGSAKLDWQKAELDLRGRRPAFMLRAALQPLAIAPLLARAQPEMGWDGDLRVRGRIDLDVGEVFRADAVLERADGDLQIGSDAGPLALGLTDLRLALAADDGLWTVTQVLAGRVLGELAGAVHARTTPQAPWPHDDAPLEGVIQARVADIAIWNAWLPAGWRVGGALQTSAIVGGRFGAPTYSGTLSGSELAVRNPLQGVDVRNGRLQVALQGDSARIETFVLRAGDGTLELSGGATFGESPQARLALTAERFRVLGRVDRRLVASGRADLLLETAQLTLDGRFAIDEGLFDIARADAPSLDDDVVIRRAADVAADADADVAARTPRRPARIDIELDLGRQLRLRGRGLDTGLRGQLRIRTPGGRLAVSGTVRTEGGTFAAYGQRLEIERGIVEFNGPPDRPLLDILALRPDIDEIVGVAISGNVQSPQVRLYSESAMTDIDKLSWLVLGRAPDGLGGNDMLLLQTAALGLLAGEGPSQTDAVIRSLGLDQFSVRQTDGDVRDTVITVGKQISRRWFVGYERGVNAATGSWRVTYRAARRITIRAQSGEDSSVDVIWTWVID